MLKLLISHESKYSISLCSCFFIAVLGILYFQSNVLLNIGYKTCWVISNNLDYRSGILNRCVTNGFEFWENQWTEKHNGNPVYETNKCNSIDAHELLTAKNTHQLFKKLTNNTSQPLVVRNVIQFLSDFKFDFNDMNPRSKGFWCYESNYTNISNYLEFELTNQIGARVAFTNVSDVYPELVKVLVNDKLFKTLFNEIRTADPTLHVAHGVSNDEELNGTKVFVDNENEPFRRFHGDLMENINFQIEGKRQWIFVDLKYVFLFKPTYSGTNIFLNMINNEYVEPNYNKYPHSKCILNSGDMVYVPNGYLHKVGFPDIGYNRFSISLPIFFENFRQLATNHYWSAIASFGAKHSKFGVKVLVTN